MLIKFINKLITRNIDNIQPKQVVYALWCNEDGFVSLMMGLFFVLMKITLEFVVGREI